MELKVQLQQSQSHQVSGTDEQQAVVSSDTQGDEVVEQRQTVLTSNDNIAIASLREEV